MNLQQFLEAEPKLRNAWIKEPGLSIYVRLGTRFLNESRTEVLEIASVAAKEIGKGGFTTFLGKAETEAKARGLTVFIENVSDLRFASFFFNRGYAQVSDVHPYCFALLRTRKADSLC